MDIWASMRMERSLIVEEDAGRERSWGFPWWKMVIERGGLGVVGVGSELSSSVREEVIIAVK